MKAKILKSLIFLAMLATLQGGSATSIEGQSPYGNSQSSSAYPKPPKTYTPQAKITTISSEERASLFDDTDRKYNALFYKYDELGRLSAIIHANDPAKDEYYAFDKQGNIVAKQIKGENYTYTFDSSNQLKTMLSPEGTREYVYDKAGRLLSETLNGEFDVSYKYGYLDKVVEVNRKGKITKYTYDGNGMLAMKTFDDGSTEVWVWDGLALIRRGDDIYVNEPHVSGGLPIISRTKHGIRYHEHDFLGTTLFSFDMKGNIVADYSDTTIYGEGSIQHDRSARFTGKPYDEDMQAYIFPYRNYDATTMRWRSADPAGYPDGINNHFYACVPTTSIDIWGLAIIAINNPKLSAALNKIRSTSYGQDTSSVFYQMDNLDYSILIKSTTSDSNFNYKENQVYINVDDLVSYTCLSSDGNESISIASIESIIIHELTHQSDYIADPDAYLENRELDGEMGGSLIEDNAIAEANKYREEVDEFIRIWHGDLASYKAANEK